MYGHVKKRKKRAQFSEFCRYLRSLYPPDVRIAIVCDNFSPHLITKADTSVGDWAEANNVEIAYTPTNSSWLNESRPSSPPCATSPSTAPTARLMMSRPA
jgi:transposase